MKKLTGILVGLLFAVVSASAWADEHVKNRKRGNIKFFLSGGFLSPSFQEFDYSGRVTEDEKPSGYGIMLDFIGKNGHALALDYYSLSSDYTGSFLGDDIPITEKSNGLLVGYRYHFRSGFYLGSGVISLQDTEVILDVTDFFTGVFGTPVDATGKVTFAPKATTAYIFGYDRVFKGGFTLGAHFIQTQAVDLNGGTLSAVVNGLTIEDPSGIQYEVERFSFRTFGLDLGYSW